MTEPGWEWVDEEQADWVPPAADTSRPSAARMYDYYLGGKDNFAVDRQAAEKVIEQFPDIRSTAAANRAFHAHAVQYMASHGIRQFLDLGSGLPTPPSTHQTARSIQPDAVVAYVDNDPIVLAHNRALVARLQGTCTVNADIRQPAAVLSNPAIKALLDLRQPLGILMISVLPFVDLALAPQVVQHYLRAVSPDSMLAISAIQVEDAHPDAMADTIRIYQQSPTPLYFRTQAQMLELFDGLDLVEPGLVDVTTWQRTTGPLTGRNGCAIGIKRPG